MMKISVVIPLYNKEKYIAKTLESVLAQTFTNIEIIVVNDGSTDRSREILGAYTDGRLRIIDQPNSGVSNARNRGIIESTGEFIFLFDADDILLPSALDNLSKAHQTSPNADMIICSALERSSDGSIHRVLHAVDCAQHSNPFKSYWERQYYPRNGNFLIRRSKLLEAGLFNSKFSLYEDLDCLMRLFANCNVCSISVVSMEYLRGEDGLSRKLPPIEKEYASAIRLREVYNHYAKLFLSDFLMRRLLYRAYRSDWHGVQYIYRLNWSQFGYMIYAFILRLFV